MARKPAAARKRGEAPKRGRAGRPPHAPTAPQRAQARLLAGLGLPRDQVALLMGIDTKTLCKHYEPELVLGVAEATRAVAATLFDRATRGKDLGAAIYWLRARAGWSEKPAEQRVKHEGSVQHDHAGVVTLTTEQRASVLAAVRARAAEEPAPDSGGAAGGL